MRKFLTILALSLVVFSQGFQANAQTVFPNRGGSGTTTITGLIRGNGTSPYTTITDGLSGQVLTTDGADGYSFQSIIKTLAAVSAASTDATKSLYTMTSTIPVEFKTSGGTHLLYLDETNERIGIGTSTPSDFLSLSGNSASRIGTTWLNTNSSPATSAFLGAYSGNMQMGTVSNHPFYLETNNTVRLSIAAAGNIGIGLNSGSAKLHVLGTTEQLRLGYDASNYASFTVNSAGALNIAPTGAGVGINTTPTHRLDVNETSVTTGKSTIYGLRTIGASGTISSGSSINGIQGQLAVSGSTTITTITATGGNFIAEHDGSSTVHALYGIRGLARTNAASTGVLASAYSVYAVAPVNSQSGNTITNAYSLYIESPTAGATLNYGLYQTGSANNYFGGKVGIGTTSPSALVHALSTTEQLRLGYDVSNYASFTVNSGGDLTIAPTGGDVTISTTLSTTQFGTRNMQIGNIESPNNGLASLVIRSSAANINPIRVYRSSDAAAVFYIENETAGSKIGIGTFSPAAKLHVLGSASGITGILQSNATTPGNLLEFQSSAAAIQSFFTSNGRLMLNRATDAGAGTTLGVVGIATTNGIGMLFQPGQADARGIVVRAFSAQTADLVQIQNSSATVVSVINASGAFGIQQSSPTAYLHLGAGTATASTAPLKFTSGTHLTTAEAGAMEYNGTSLFFTRTGTTRETVNTTVTKTDTGDGTGAEGLFQINTFDNTFKVYAEGAWRTLATW